MSQMGRIAVGQLLKPIAVVGEQTHCFSVAILLAAE